MCANDELLNRLPAAVRDAVMQVLRQGRTWNISVNTYQEAKQVAVVPNCFAFMFTNVGDTTAFVNGMVIFPSATPATALGDSRSIAGHWLDLYKGNMTLKFDPVNAAPNVEIVQLFYLEGNVNNRP